MSAAPTTTGLIVHVLGSGSGLPTARRDTTALLIGAVDGWTLIDCPGSVVHRLARLGIAVNEVRRVLLTHDHVDHIYGFPHLVHAMAVRGGCAPLPVYAPAATLATIERATAAYSLAGPRSPELSLHPIEMTRGAAIDTGSELRIRCAPTRHGRDTVAVRLDAGSVSLGHSSDTRPSEAIAELCRGVDLLFHDCAGLHRESEGWGGDHSSARQAGEIAAAAEASILSLIHLSPAAERDEAALREEAMAVFDGDVRVARDGGQYRLNGG